MKIELKNAVVTVKDGGNAVDFICCRTQPVKSSTTGRLDRVGPAKPY